MDISAGAIVQVTLWGELDLQRMMTVLHYRYKSGSPTTEYFAALDGLRALQFPTTGGLKAAYRACCGQDYTLDYETYQAIYPTRLRGKQYDEASGAGTVAVDSFPPGTSVSITKQGLLANRHGIGGVRMPAVPNTWNNQGQLTGPAITAYTDFADFLNNTLTVATTQIWEPIIFNRTTPADSQVTLSLILQRSIRTMKRRVLGRGI